MIEPLDRLRYVVYFKMSGTVETLVLVESRQNTIEMLGFILVFSVGAAYLLRCQKKIKIKLVLLG